MNCRLWIVLSISLALTGCLVETTTHYDQTNDWPLGTDQMIGTNVAGRITSAGASAVEFLPTKPTSLAGFGSFSRRLFPPVFGSNSSVSYCRAYQNVKDPPRIKTAVLNLEPTSPSVQSKVFLISLDIVAVTADLSKKVMKVLDEVFGSGTSKISNTFITSTHTHSGPAGLTESPLWSAFVCDSYNESLTSDYLEKLKVTLKKADSLAIPVVEVHSHNWKAESYLKSRIEGMDADTDVSLIKFVTQNGESPLALLEMAVHPTTLGAQSLTLSADLVTPLESAFAAEFSVENVFLMQTHAGNMESNKGSRNTTDWAQALAQELKKTNDSKNTLSLSLKSSASTIPLPSKSINWNGCQAKAARYFVSLPILEELPARAPVAKLQIGEQTRFYLPGEWTTSAAQQAITLVTGHSQLARDNIKILSMAYDYTGYHIDREFYEKASIESCSSLYGVSGLEQILTSLKESSLLTNL